jgi:hypothetical protein
MPLVFDEESSDEEVRYESSEESSDEEITAEQQDLMDLETQRRDETGFFDVLEEDESEGEDLGSEGAMSVEDQELVQAYVPPEVKAALSFQSGGADAALAMAQALADEAVAFKDDFINDEVEFDNPNASRSFYRSEHRMSKELFDFVNEQMSRAAKFVLVDLLPEEMSGDEVAAEAKNTVLFNDLDLEGALAVADELSEALRQYVLSDDISKKELNDLQDYNTEMSDKAVALEFQAKARVKKSNKSAYARREIHRVRWLMYSFLMRTNPDIGMGVMEAAFVRAKQRAVPRKKEMLAELEAARAEAAAKALAEAEARAARAAEQANQPSVLQRILDSMEPPPKRGPMVYGGNQRSRRGSKAARRR